MRLINTITGQFQEFFESQQPRYAMLSHTWGSEEVSYLDFLFLTSNLPATSAGVVQAMLKNPKRDSEGIRKIQGCCQLARSRGVEWIWIDTCCIDKSSSAELSEAINSMWRWYGDAAECYVYLFDVSVRKLVQDGSAWEQFRKSRWFTRGWTLQELLAPKNLFLCNSQWDILATKAEVGRELSEITRIPLIFLDGTYSPSDNKVCSVAMKMSWVSRRQTTRTEDMAYCMLGLFDVHMPLIYGEGRKAFMRLQLEILKKLDDDSIYAWTAPLDKSGLLATWPTAFVGCNEIVQINFPDDDFLWLPPVMTSIGLELRARYPRHDPHQNAIDAACGVHTLHMSVSTHDKMVIVMHCGPSRDKTHPVTENWTRGDYGFAVVIKMQRFGATWQRVDCNRLDFTKYTMSEPSSLDAYKIYYVKQQGL